MGVDLFAWLQMLTPIGTARRRIAIVRRTLIARAARLVTPPGATGSGAPLSHAG